MQTEKIPSKKNQIRGFKDKLNGYRRQGFNNKRLEREENCSLKKLTGQWLSDTQRKRK